MTNEQETSNDNSNNNNNNGTCVVCYRKVEIYSIGMCEHPVCYECSTRMRVLCCQNECPICRQDLPKVVFTREVKPFRDIRKGNLLDTRYNIFFDSIDIQEKFIQLLAHVCPICKDKQVFGVFTGLKDHMRRKHELNYCDLCVENLKIFSYERRCYTRVDLAHHRRKGDVDDKSHKGHPLCEFCDCRYMDNDELFRHLRRDHLFCHFCDADGLHQYYSSYDYLRDHFRQEHYLCEEGPCAEEKFTSVFRSVIDMKAHKSSVHCKFMGKAAAKQARTLELEFTLAPRGDNRNGHRNQPGNHSGPSNSRNSRDNYSDYRDFPDAESSYSVDSEISSPLMKQPDVQSTQEFPSLGNAASTPVCFGQTKSKGRGNLTIRGSFGSQRLSVNNENFPALGTDFGNPGVSNTVNLSVYSSNKASSSGTKSSSNSTPNVSIQVNHKTNGSITTRVTRPNVKPVAQLPRKTDFPALGNGTSLSNSASSTNTAQWTKVTCVKPVAVQKIKKVSPAPQFDNSPSDAFPSLPKTAKAKKQSSISVPSTNTLSTTLKASKSTDNTHDQKITHDTINPNSKKKKKKKTKTVTSSNSSGNESGTSKSTLKNNDQILDQANGTTCSKPTLTVVKKNIKSLTDKESDINKKEKKKIPNTSSNQIINEIEKSQSNNNNNNNNNNSNSNGIRKRSELKIDNLNNGVKKLDDFPVLGKSPKVSVPMNPPPGFSTARPSPPPGFAVKINSIARPQINNDLTFTNSSGESFSILPEAKNKSYTYLPPPDFQTRNKNLVAEISEVLELQEAIEEFRYLSGLFRQDLCTTEDYYKRCRTEMGLSAFATVFPEMLVLLPDIRKQRELYDIHKKEIGGKVKGLELCPTCGQVCKIEDDIKSHLSSHSLENHFPALGAAAATQSSSNWPRKGT